ncbi:MAG: ABC transporter substrate-binding protein [Alphaproteobacteria bacterium]
MNAMRAIFGGIVALVLSASAMAPARAIELVEPPFLADKVAAGELAPVAERLPETPAMAIFEGERELGAYGGDLRMLMAKQKDIRMMTVYGYARLIGYNRDLLLVPDMLERVDIEEGRIFTLTLRKGHKWSDGAPFTSEDFRYYWEDVVNNETISPFGVPKVLLIDGEAPRVEFIDEITVRYSWSNPNPFFLPALAGARPLYIYRPAHYLKQFHARYNDKETLEAVAAEAKAKGWAGLHQRRDHQYRFDNPDLPTLQPWMNITRPPSERYVFLRNPYYHRMDSAGLQLPYIDRLVVDIANNKLIAAKAAFGESDLQARYIRFDNYTFLKENEDKHDYATRLWNTVNGSQFALYPNLNVTDPVWRALTRDVRFRRALSLAIDRTQINQVIYFGLAREGNNTVLAESPLYEESYQTAWASFDPDQANALLDEIGLTERDDDDIRLLPNGEPIEVIVDTAGESTEETDILELIQDNWRDIGIALFTKPSQREVFRNRVYSGEAMMSVWYGITNGVSTAAMSPAELAPTEQTQLQWPKWGQFHETAGSAGLEADMPQAIRLAELNAAWRVAADDDERGRIWSEMLKIHSEQMYSIGVLNAVPQPVIINNQLRNLPEVGIYSWEPSSYFGIYKPDSFWFTEARRSVAQ